MTNSPDNPFARWPEQPPGEPPAQPYGQQPGYGAQPSGATPPPYGGSAHEQPVYGQQPPASNPPPYPGAPQYPGASQYPGAPQYAAAPGYGYGAAPYAPYGAVYPKNSLGVWALVLGIASFALSCFFVTGIPAIVIGRQGQRAADEGLADNRGLSTAGVVLGWVAVGLSVAVVGLAILGLAAGSFSWLSVQG